MLPANTPARQIFTERKDNYITLPQGPMKASREQKLCYFLHSIILKALLTPTTLELVLSYIDCINDLSRSLSDTFNLQKLNYTFNKSSPQ